jgi:hypothetical protein
MNKSQINSITALYKNNQDDGFGFTFTDEIMDLNVLLESIRGQADIYDNLIATKQWTKKEINDELMRQLTKDIIPLLWKEMYSTTSNPPAGSYVTVDINVLSNDAKRSLANFFISVSWLTQQQVILDDNFNGMMYSYTN